MASPPKSLTRFELSLRQTCKRFRRRGVSIAVSTDTRVKEVSVTEEVITFSLVDGRVVSVPLAWSWRLSEATPAQRNNFEIIGDGYGVHWPDVDEDLSVEGMLYGVPAPRPKM
ncbi:hypothetical protein CLG94_03615 [Candidatus Methylomirabilis limnetica]|uniref:DUF2442 domain-containing protein n=1 Tax=Candidatus Methylomirabilis limnetica TaxID=2033718 RepID=A0A2T4TZF6_9BACT|nr:hypothetical protein CLG94_03615 [Candidatus Methylomirabilis limnetica]